MRIFTLLVIVGIGILIGVVLYEVQAQMAPASRSSDNYKVVELPVAPTAPDDKRVLEGARQALPLTQSILDKPAQEFGQPAAMEPIQPIAPLPAGPPLKLQPAQTLHTAIIPVSPVAHNPVSPVATSVSPVAPSSPVASDSAVALDSPVAHAPIPQAAPPAVPHAAQQATGPQYPYQRNVQFAYSHATGTARMRTIVTR